MSCKITIRSPMTTTYPVGGATLEDVQKDIKKKGPKDPNDNKNVAAITDTEVRVHDRWLPEVRKVAYGSDGKAEVTVGVKTMSIIISTIIHMPRLGTNTLSAKAKKEWDRFRKKLFEHEKQHINVAKGIAQYMDKDIAKITGTAKGETDTKAETAAKKDLLKNYLAKYSSDKIKKIVLDGHARYDKRTDHGAKYGAKLDTSIQ